MFDPYYTIGLCKAGKWISVDDYSRYMGNVGWSIRKEIVDIVDISSADSGAIDGRIQDVPKEFFGKFDVIFSNATLEHVTELDEALHIMKVCLRPGGKMYHNIGPIWSGSMGHHLFETYLSEFGPDAGKAVSALLRPWIHLVHDKDGLSEYLNPHVGHEIAEAAAISIYDSDRINRLSFQEYMDAFERAGLNVYFLHKWKKRVADDHYLNLLNPKNRADHMFNVFTVVLE